MLILLANKHFSCKNLSDEFLQLLYKLNIGIASYQEFYILYQQLLLEYSF